MGLVCGIREKVPHQVSDRAVPSMAELHGLGEKIRSTPELVLLLWQLDDAVLVRVAKHADGIFIGLDLRDLVEQQLTEQGDPLVGTDQSLLCPICDRALQQ